MAGNLAYYITGHGYGHTVRSVEIIKTLLQRRPGLTVHVRTSAPAWLFAELASDAFHYHQTHLDVGALQSNSYYVDKARTLSAYADLIAHKRDLLQQEVRFLREQKISAIVSDITPLAFEAADALHLPGIGVANFSWDWIYQDWLKEFPSFQSVVDDIRSSYSKATLLLRLPFYGDLSAFSRIIDIPLVARRCDLSREQARQQLQRHLAIDRKLVLLGLRHADIHQVPLARIESMSEYHFITTQPALQASNITWLPEGSVPFQHLVKACDVILSKPGYSMVAEVIANQTRLVYVVRNDFCEDPILRQALQDYSVCQEISMEAFNAGSWQPSLKTVLAKPAYWPPIPIHGAEVAANQIIEALK